MRQLVRKWRRSAGIKIVLSLDDGICTNGDYNKILSQAAIIREDLNKAGFITNAEKSIWVPTKTITWLGFLIDLRQCVMKLP